MMVKLNGCIFIEDDEKLDTYNNIWNRANDCIKKELDCEPTCNKTFRKTKIRPYNNETTDFHDKEVSKVGFN